MAVQVTTCSPIPIASVMPEAITPQKDMLARIPVLLKHHPKTLDIGLDGHTLSSGPFGDILQISCFHPVHGMVVACPFAQFDGERFYDSSYVRDYRKLLLDHVLNGTRGFGVNFDGEISNLNISFLDNQWILITYQIRDIHISTTLSIGKKGEIIQSIEARSASTGPTDLHYAFSLKLSVNRASYGQLTEGGPIPIPVSRNDLRLPEPGHWAVINKSIDAMIEGDLCINGEPVWLQSQMKEQVLLGEPINKTFRGTVRLLPGKSCTIVSTFGLRPGTMLSEARPIRSTLKPSEKGRWKFENNEAGLIIRRNLEYILGNCTFPVGYDDVCFITDHVALPLGWNRDNYWQIRFLLDISSKLDVFAYPETAALYKSQIQRSIRGHLNWVFRKAQRPHGYWHRSYLANGVPKDGPVFQQDQQCYPLLELCDFYDCFPQEQAFVLAILREQTITDILRVIESRRDAATGLYPTDETPGDDAVEYPFHFSTSVLLWYTIKRLSSLIESLSINTNLEYSHLTALASEIHSSTVSYFTAQHPETGETLFAYLTSGTGEYTFYHDANDIPTLFADDWGFLSTPELYSTWTRTLDFALSDRNVGGYYPDGEFGGLGSVHTRGPWPLGYAQEFVYANLRENKEKAQDAWRRIKGAMFWDGLFPEAVDSKNGACVSKAWFSWPGSMIGSALLRFGEPSYYS